MTLVWLRYRHGSVGGMHVGLSALHLGGTDLLMW